MPSAHADAIAAELRKVVTARRRRSAGPAAEAAFDTLSAVNELRDAGFEDRQARAIIDTCKRVSKATSAAATPNRWTGEQIATLGALIAVAFVIVGALVVVSLQ